MTSVQSDTVRSSIDHALKGSTELAALLGGVRIYGRAPEACAFPYITVGQSALRDWSTGSEHDAEQSLTVHVSSPFGGRKHMQDVIKTVRAALDERALRAGHYLVSLQHEFSEARLDPEGDTRGIIRYRARLTPAQAVAA